MFKNCKRCNCQFYKNPKDSKKQWDGRLYCSISCKNKQEGEDRSVPIEERFWLYVDKKSELECWLWTGAADKKGYGRLSRGYKESPIKAYRLSYIIHNGEISNGKVVRHKCDNPACVNPTHLEIGTQKDNSMDMVSRGRQNRKSLLNLRPGKAGFHGAGPASVMEIINA